MKKIDYFLLIFVFCALAVIIYDSDVRFGFLIRILLAFIILCLFLYSKIKPFKSNLSPNLKKFYLYIDFVFDKIFNFMGKFLKPVVIGTNLSIDISQIILLIILLILILL